MNVGADSESGIIDIDKILVGETLSQREKVRMVYDVIQAYQDTNYVTKVPIVEVIKGMVKQGVSDMVASEYINKMIKKGSLMKVGAEFVVTLKE